MTRPDKALSPTGVMPLLNSYKVDSELNSCAYHLNAHHNVQLRHISPALIRSHLRPLRTPAYSQISFFTCVLIETGKQILGRNSESTHLLLSHRRDRESIDERGVDKSAFAPKRIVEMKVCFGTLKTYIFNGIMYSRKPPFRSSAEA